MTGLALLHAAATSWSAADLRREMLALQAAIDADCRCRLRLADDPRWPIVRAMRKRIAAMERAGAVADAADAKMRRGKV